MSGFPPTGRPGATGNALRLVPIGFVRSALAEVDLAPRQGDEGAPTAWIDLSAEWLDALRGLEAGQEVIAITWLDRARRDVLVVHPRGDQTREQLGVFATRSPHRPNPLGLHRIRLLEVEGSSIRVENLEAVDGTPVIDLKPVLSSDIGER